MEIALLRALYLAPCRRTAMIIKDKTTIETPPQTRQPQTKSQKGASFAQVLSETTRKSEPTTEAEKAADTGGLMESTPVGRILAAATASQPAAQAIDQALSALDRFAQALADPARTLKEIAPLADELESEAGRLSELGQGLPEGHELKDLTERTGVLAAVESVKFKRGDYI